jgi:hypothetical protein
MDPIALGGHLFSPEALQSAIQQTAGLAADKKGALIVTVDTNGAQVALVANLATHIELQVAGKWDLGTGNLSAGAKLIASW